MNVKKKKKKKREQNLYVTHKLLPLKLQETLDDTTCLCENKKLRSMQKDESEIRNLVRIQVLPVLVYRSSPLSVILEIRYILVM